MHEYYSSLLKDAKISCVYATPRGIGDSWEMHRTKEHEKLINQLIARCRKEFQIDVNRVILVGLQAGADGAHLLGSYLCDKFCFVSASAGHPNYVSYLMRKNVASMIQVGELDSQYQRNEANLEKAVEAQILYSTFGSAHCLLAMHQAKDSMFNDFG